MKLWSFAQVRFSLTLKMFPQTTDRVPKKSGSAHMKSIWNVAPCQARNLMIGCKPNANSSLGRRQSSGIFDQGRGPMKRRDFIKDSAVSALALGAPSQSLEGEVFASRVSTSQAESEGSFWPDGARLVVSISMQMEAGAQPRSGKHVGRNSQRKVVRFCGVSNPFEIQDVTVTRCRVARLSVGDSL